jgi:EAL domain-containing protein (putative c-di-GMP-specific phosphodiesterase class I)
VVTSAGAEGIAKIVAQARELGLNVTAEGVETAEQLARLKACGCDRVQGFLFARPMSAGELSTFAGLTLG